MNNKNNSALILDSLFEAFSYVSSANYVYVCDMKTDLSRWNREAVNYFSLPSEYMTNAGEIWASYIHPDDREEFISDVKKLFSGEQTTHNLQYRVRNRFGQYVVCTCRGVVLKNDNGEPNYFCGAMTNHGIENENDVLTGLKNQYGFFLELNNILAEKTHCNLIMLGFTKFLNINNMYGYTIGNRVLQHAARFLQKIADPDDRIYRLDGTRFVIITERQSLEHIHRVYNGVLERMRSYSLNGMRINLSLCGSVMKLNNFNITNKTIYSCLNYSYQISKNQRHGALVEFNNKPDQTDIDQLVKINIIRNSVGDNCKGFYLKYQPIVDASSEKVMGAEALIRWENSRLGEVRPDEFIPVLENDNVFPVLGMWILRQAMQDALEIVKDNPDFIVSVNLAYSQCEQGNFVNDVISLVESIGFPPHNLCLEITERCRLLDMELLSRIAFTLHSYGIRLALDDFGTGFSSLMIVKTIPFDTIKIDRSFIQDICENDKSEQIVKSITDIATAYGAGVCVEGIENEIMRDKVRKYQVKSIQGFFYSKPVIFDEFKSFCKKGRCLL
ncbi:EAL domain-containing protein [uncultured Succinivibrio sp.]|uniref:EAL domain-containing protein n=1 Tax=uncultured Succinivibrio sp. TaxID=540749 RepID=UPI0025E5A177|nr:EAL domain-containing protein [uncultured Succinivibrio sp.]